MNCKTYRHLKFCSSVRRTIFIIDTLNLCHFLFTGNGVTYVRWGRTTCPGNSEMVYTGNNAHVFRQPLRVKLGIHLFLLGLPIDTNKFVRLKKYSKYAMTLFDKISNYTRNT